MSSPDLLRLAEQFAAASARRDAVALKRIASAYARMYRRLSGQIEALAEQVGGGQMTTGQLARFGRWQALREQIAGELGDFSSYVRVELSSTAEDAIARALSDSRSLIGISTQGAGLSVAFNSLPTNSVMRLLGFLQTGSPLYKRLALLSPVNAKALADLFVEGVGLGWNPRKIAAMMRRQFGANLTDALRMTRTAQLYAYREATRANYINNPEIVQGWYWMAALGQPQTCMSCIRMHGTFHKLSERLNDHHNGRCTMLPAVKGFGNPIKQSGEEWFNAQPPDVQKSHMGPEYWQAWKDGKYSFGNISREYDNDVYGPMRVATTLKELLGGG
jgi:NAD(P)-dependent dehydrogenase (short-subunit alcohol dehydrogenase family)